MQATEGATIAGQTDSATTSTSPSSASVSRRYRVAMAHEHIERSVTRRPWTRPTLRRLASGHSAAAYASLTCAIERTVSSTTPSGTVVNYYGPAPS
jgi:hypothetical protein